MKKSQFLIVVILAVMSGLIGGAFSGRILNSKAEDSKYPQRIIAHSFYLVDKNGKPRAGMGFDEGEFPTLFVKDKNGRTSAFLAHGPEGPMIIMCNANGETAIFLKADCDGHSMIGLMKERKKPRLVLSYSPGKGPGVSLFDENDTCKVMATILNNNPSIGLLGKDNQPAIGMFSKPGAGSTFGIWDSQGKTQAMLGLIDDKPMLYLYQKYQTGMLFRTTSAGKPGLALLDNGSIVWSAAGGATPAPPDASGLDDIMRDVMR
ncbi:MAG: hypothetical protein AB1814_04510 [Thermodesulfobacteriota bacterium]